MRHSIVSLAIVSVLLAQTHALEIQTAGNYLAAGEKMAGKVSVGDAPKDARLRVSVIRQTDIPASATTTNVIIDQPATGDVTFELDSAGMLAGTLQMQATVTGGSFAVSAPVSVGIRQRLSLAGEWTVTKVEPLELEGSRRPKDWKQPAFDKPVKLPGALTSDPWFRGWVTVKRELPTPVAGELRPRAVKLSGVSNSALVRINDAVVGEVQPETELDCELSHWSEFHSQFKGDANKRKRLLTGDAVVLPPLTLVLPKAVTGPLTVELTIRGTSGAMRPKPPYGIFGDLHLELLPPVFVKAVTFDTEKLGEKRRFKFQVTLVNESGAAFKGKLRTVYGRYLGELPYTGACPAYATADQEVSLPVGETTVEVDRDELPRFDTCRAMFMVLGKGDQVLDAAPQDFHTVVLEIRDRRDLYLNNERFIVKAQGSSGLDANSRFNLRVNGVNAFRGQATISSKQFPGLLSEVEAIDERYREGLLTSAGSALLASCERCVFWNPQDTGNITRAAQKVIRELGQCPGIFEWEVTNELYGEPDEARIAIQTAFHKFDPYHRPVLATKGGGEWEAVARDGRVPGVDIVGCQYLLSEEGVHSVTAAVTEQPLMCTEVNWNDTMLMEHNMWETWLNNGLAGALLFDYSGHATAQPVPLIPPETDRSSGVFLQKNRQLFQDIVPTARRQADGSVRLTLANRMPYRLENLKLYLRDLGAVPLPALAPGDAANVVLAPAQAPAGKEPVVARAEYTTHAGLRHLAILTPAVEGGAK